MVELVESVETTCRRRCWPRHAGVKSTLVGTQEHRNTGVKCSVGSVESVESVETYVPLQ